MQRNESLEYIRPSQAHLFGISRALLYTWLREGKVKSFSPLRVGNTRGPRLVSVASLKAAIEGSTEK